jgi:ankyrin repeat protein
MMRAPLWLVLAFICILAPNAMATTPHFRDIESLIKKKDLAALRAALQSQPELASTRSESGLTPLTLAAYLEQPDMVRAIRERKAATQALDFFEACIVGDIDSIRRELARGQDIDQRSPDGFTPLGLAIFFRQPETARLLMDAGANLDKKAANTVQVGPIHAAVARSDLHTLQTLLLRGADANATQQRLMRPIHEAAAAGNLPIVAMLLLFGADIAARNEDGKTAVDFARDAGHLDLANRLARVPKP